MNGEGKFDWCWSNDAVIALAIVTIILFLGIFPAAVLTEPYGGQTALFLAIIVTIVVIGFLCYACHDFFEQDKKFKAERWRKKSTRKHLQYL